MIAVALTIGLLAMNVASAGGIQVDINEVQELSCGEQGMIFSGDVYLHEGHELIVELDEKAIKATVNQEAKTWQTSSHTLAVGNHEIYVYIIEEGGEWNHHVPDALWEFTIKECPAPSPSEEPKEEENEGSDDPGDEQDCEVSTNPDACGEGYTNEEPDTLAPVGKVKGIGGSASSTSTPKAEPALQKLPAAGPSALLPLMLVGSWFTVAGVGFKKKW